MSVIFPGDCIEVMATMDAESVDAIVTDPPYGLGFMGKRWDALPPGCEWAERCLRVLRPGGYLLAFGGTRTSHRLVCAVEDAGFEIRDTICWLYGSGFPKSHNLKGEREGWGTALKPAHEPIVVARKPLVGTVAANVLEHGTGAINVDGCRVEHITVNGGNLADNPHLRGSIKNTGSAFGGDGELVQNPTGRWPANVVLDENAAGMLDAQTGTLQSGSGELNRNADKFRNAYGAFAGGNEPADALYGDSGGASRFFYVAKASRAERNAGLDGFEERVRPITDGHGCGAINTSKAGDGIRENKPTANVRPTVKPLILMRWLVRLVTPPGGTVLDPFTGSGTTGCACALEGFEFVGIEREPEYVAIAEARIAHWSRKQRELAA